MLAWSKDWFLVASLAENQKPTFTITDTKLYVLVYVLVVTLPSQDNVKLFKNWSQVLKEQLIVININLM